MHEISDYLKGKKKMENNILQPDKAKRGKRLLFTRFLIIIL